MDGYEACPAHPSQFHFTALPAGGKLFWGEEFGGSVGVLHRPPLFTFERLLHEDLAALNHPKERSLATIPLFHEVSDW